MIETAWKIRYPAELPITLRVDEIREIWRRNQLIIVCGATGSGKTTQLPKIALELRGDASGLIGCTQPRRLAATAMAGRTARELGVNLGREVGYQVRFDDRTGRDTVVKFMTDGILLAETRSDPAFRRYQTLIIDEAHERSLNIDFILGYLKNLLPKRPELKVAISSATLDAAKFSEFFGNAPVIEVEGRQYDIEDVFLEPERDEDLTELIGRGVRFLSDYDRRGDMLIFLPGEREIRDAADLLTGWKLPHTEVLPLFGRLSLREQERVFQVGQRRRIVLATNVAETSVTIPGIDFVIDSGLVRMSRYNARTQVQELQIETVSQAAARQRRGRCGRVGEGVCLHLYSEETLRNAPEYTDPEIKRTALAGVILQMALLRLPRIEHFPFIDPPTGALIREGRRALLDIQALNPEGSLTRDGRRIAQMALDPHLAKMVLHGAGVKLTREMLILTAFLSMQDPRERPLDAQQQADEKHRAWKDERSDYLAILKLWEFLYGKDGAGVSNSALRRACRANFLNYPRVREWKSLVEDLNDALEEVDLEAVKDFSVDPEKLPYDLLHQSLLAGIPRHVGCFDPEAQLYEGTGGRKFHLFPGSWLFKRKKKAQWVMTFALVETTRLFARQNAEIRPDYLPVVAPHLCVATYDQEHFDPQSGFVYARERLTFGGLLVHGGKRVHYGKSHPVEARKIFIREALAGGAIVSRHPQVRRYTDFLHALERLEIKVRRPGTIVDIDALIGHFEALLPAAIVSQQALERWLDAHTPANWLPAGEAVMLEQFRPVRPADYPDILAFAGHRLPLAYDFNPGEEPDGVTLTATSEELPLIPRWEPEFLIPGWLPEKVELMLKHLPKNQRQQCIPLTETVEAYMEFLQTPAVDRSSGLAASLAAFLTEWTGHAFQWRDFEGVRLPDYLTMKIAEVDADGNRIALHRELPHSNLHGSRVSRLVVGVARHQTAAGSDWPDGEFPQQIPLANGDKQGYPALAPEGEGVARQVFLHAAEARVRHSAGLVRLFRLREAGLVKFIRRDLKFTNEMQLGILRHDHAKRYRDDLVDAAIRRALGADEEALWQIRDRRMWEERLLVARTHAADEADKLIALLNGWQKEWNGRITPLLHKIESRSATAAAQVRDQLNYYFRPGFLGCDAPLARYDRYLRGMVLRLERAIHDPAKDAAKAEPLAVWLDRFRLALAADADPVWNVEFREFRLLLDEFILSCFAPEVRLLGKASPQRLEELWSTVRL